MKCEWKAIIVLFLLCLFQGQDGDYEDLLTYGSISTLLDTQSFSDLEKSLSSTPVMGSPSHDPFNTSVPEEVFTDSQYFFFMVKRLSLKVKESAVDNTKHMDYFLSLITDLVCPGNVCVLQVFIWNVRGFFSFSLVNKCPGNVKITYIIWEKLESLGVRCHLKYEIVIYN